MRVPTVAVGIVIALGAALAAKPALNVSGMCTEGPISDWHYASIDETLAFLEENTPVSSPLADAPRLATRYSDAALAERPVDGFPQRSLINMANGAERFLIKVEVDRIVNGSPRHDTNFIFIPNCLHLAISGL